MKVNKNFKAVILGPSYGLLEIRILALDIWLSSADVKRPISNGNPNVVESVVKWMRKV
jgi:hypothetical protein